MKNRNHAVLKYITPLLPKGYNDGSHKTTRDDIITPGASTVAESKTVKTNLRDSMGLKQSVK
jgi:hypothetical protein